jgi:hypothetical protein
MVVADIWVLRLSTKVGSLGRVGPRVLSRGRETWLGAKFSPTVDYHDGLQGWFQGLGLSWAGLKLGP